MIHIAAEKPEGVPEENWLPITRKDEVLDVILRVYVPDLVKMKSWTPPRQRSCLRRQRRQHTTILHRVTKWNLNQF